MFQKLLSNVEKNRGRNENKRWLKSRGCSALCCYKYVFWLPSPSLLIKWTLIAHSKGLESNILNKDFAMTTLMISNYLFIR